MPGIAGIIGRGSAEVCRHLLDQMVAAMKPDPFLASGTHCAPDLGVFVGWVAHRGSFAARHSARISDQGLRLAWTGECFAAGTTNPPQPDDLAARLRDLGGDRGDGVAAQLNGLFGGVLIDTLRNRALLVNDRYGGERIYVCEQAGTTYFASEAKALLRVVPETRALDPQGVAQVLKYGSTLGDKTLFRNVRLLPGASLWTFEYGACSTRRRYFRPEQWHPDSVLSEDAFEARFIETFRRVLPRYVAAEDRIGIAVTGGLDTRMIMSCLPETPMQPICYTYAGTSGETLDVRIGSRVARCCGLDHQVIRIGPDFLAEFSTHVDRTVYATDGCLGVLGTHELYLSRIARTLSSIRLTGNYGSELLRSMSTFKPLGLDERLIDPDFRAVVDAVPMPADGVHPVTRAAFCEVPLHLFGNFCAGRSQFTQRTPFLDNDLVELAYRAPASARTSPRAALRLVAESSAVLAAIPTDQGLLWDDDSAASRLRRLIYRTTFKLDYLHKQGLPSSLLPLHPLFRIASGLGLLGMHKFLPYHEWFRTELAGYLHDGIHDALARRAPWWNASFLATLVPDQVQGRRNYIHELDIALTIEAAERLLVRGADAPA